MKNTITYILLILAAAFTANGLAAQTPRPVHGTKTDQEIQKEDEQSGDRTYKEARTEAKGTRTRGKSDRADKNKQYRNEKGKRTECQSQKQDIGDRKGKGYGRNMKQEAIKQTMRGQKGQMKKEERFFKKHPIFERRADARNGKGEAGRG